MTQSNGHQPDRLDRVEATLDRIAERMDRMAGQSELDRQAANERMTQIERQADADRRATNERMIRIEQQADADRQQAAEEHQQIRENLATLNEITIDFMGVTRNAFERMDQTINRLDQTIAELRAANQRQERINDFLLRERGANGG